MWTLTWLNWSVATINATLQLLDIYRYGYRDRLVSIAQNAQKKLT